MVAAPRTVSDRHCHYLQTANIRTHYTKSQYMYESRCRHNNHLPLSAIPGTRVRWSVDDVGWPDCATTDGNETNCFPRKDIACPKSRSCSVCVLYSKLLYYVCDEVVWPHPVLRHPDGRATRRAYAQVVWTGLWRLRILVSLITYKFGITSCHTCF